MSNRQIQPVRNRDVQIIRQARPRSLWGQVWNVALQPNTFFLALPQAPSSSRQWFWVAVLILALNGFAAVRQDAVASGGGATVDPGFSQGSEFPSSDFSSGPGGFSAQPGGLPGGLPSDFGAPTDGGSTGSGADVSSTWVTALISATTILIGWFVLAVILCEVPLFNGVRPHYGQNLQIAIWTTVPLGVMAGLQVIYIAATGVVGASGVSGLLDIWKGYNDLSPLVRSILLSLTSRLTIFWVWSLVLIFIGARQALNGKVWSSLLVVVIWVLVVVMVPVVTGTIKAPELPVEGLPEPIVLPEDPFASPTEDTGLFEGEITPATDDVSGGVEGEGLPTDEFSGDFNAFATDNAINQNPIFATPLPLTEESGVISTVESDDRSDEKDAITGATVEPTLESSEGNTTSRFATPTPANG
ncbi:MAG: YIP1 family protein [Chloroflexi bacterium]|nr:YIP1 family protein [Chloroflexota bacterium]MCC6894536.1 YIP1 family protein [Anaerolineae bacterium]